MKPFSCSPSICEGGCYVSDLKSLQKIWSFNKNSLKMYSFWHITITNRFVARFLYEVWRVLMIHKILRNHSPPQSMTDVKTEIFSYNIKVIDWVKNFIKILSSIWFSIKISWYHQVLHKYFPEKSLEGKVFGDKKKISLLYQEIMHWSVH